MTTAVAAIPTTLLLALHVRQTSSFSMENASLPARMDTTLKISNVPLVRITAPNVTLKINVWNAKMQWKFRMENVLTTVLQDMSQIKLVIIVTGATTRTVWNVLLQMFA
jgi:hypothetical protein